MNTHPHPSTTPRNKRKIGRNCWGVKGGGGDDGDVTRRGDSVGRISRRHVWPFYPRSRSFYFPARGNDGGVCIDIGPRRSARPLTDADVGCSPWHREKPGLEGGGGDSHTRQRFYYAISQQRGSKHLEQRRYSHSHWINIRRGEGEGEEATYFQRYSLRHQHISNSGLHT